MEIWSAQRMLESWGLRVSGGSLKAPLPVRTGGSAGTDDEWQAKCYVETIKGFKEARPVLVWVYGEGLPANRFPIRQPGEKLADALKRRGWLDYMLVSPSEIAQAVVDDFLVELSETLSRRPFRPVRDPEPETVEQIAATAGLRVA